MIVITHDRWFSRVIIEGQFPRAVAEEGESDQSSSEGEEEESRRGRTYRVGAGKVKELEKGMKEYVGIVERKLERERKRREAGGG